MPNFSRFFFNCVSVFFDTNGLLLITTHLLRWLGRVESPNERFTWRSRPGRLLFLYFQRKVEVEKNGTSSDVQRSVGSNYLPIIYVGNMYLYAFISEKSSLHLRWTSFVKCRKTYIMISIITKSAMTFSNTRVTVRYVSWTKILGGL